ncbi:acyl-coenzyme A thioesterase 13-like [Osmia bicornis bicornis]|uniref:acyl-coenzyme A thioesterase 13-like n=1 Tax=Osmia bicornis bicornis TaxID=1437191 RepID=UPI0010F848EB|nr:acyl-coenzyme A thioesterase 13-like [Osmia bicornis bicornis]
MCKTQLIKAVVENVISKTNFGQCMKKIKIISAGSGNCKAELVISDEHLNAGGTLHGGFTSTLIDCISSYAVMTQGAGVPGVSVDLHVTFMKAAFPDELITIDAKTVRAGKSLAFLAVDVTKNNGVDMVAHGRHTKYLLQGKQ